MITPDDQHKNVFCIPVQHSDIYVNVDSRFDDRQSLTDLLKMDSEGDDRQASEYSYISDNSYDTIDELLKRFTLEYTPDYSLKLRDTYVLG